MEMPPPLPCLAMVHGVGAQDQPPTATTLISVADARPLAGAGVLALEEELKNKYLCPTPQGWMLVHDPDAATTYLLDAKRRQKIQLPRLAVEQRLIPYCSCLLSGEPTAAGCPVVLLVEPIDATIWYCRVGDSEWTRHEYDIGTVGDEYFVEKRVIAPIAAFGGRFYFNPVPAETRVLELLLRPGAAALAPVFGSVAREPESTEDDGFVGTAEVFMVGTGDELYQVMLAQNGGRHEYDIGTVGDEHLVEKRVISPIAAFGGRFYFNPVPSETRVLELLLRPGAAALAPVFGSVTMEHEST
ncbi:hypothetical protein ACQ4PT_025493 [Festuca glaucescens]